MVKSIAIIGAGAKAAALVARASVLRDALGAGVVPQITVFEAQHIASSWDGGAGHSSGYLTLCTPGEKDVGFPYPQAWQRPEHRVRVASTLFARFSFHAFLVARGRYSEWVDRGRDHPSHSRWAKYLTWVFRQAKQPVENAKVLRIVPLDGRWRVHWERNGQVYTTDFDGVVLTGTGRPRNIPCTINVPYDRVFDAETFWKKRENVALLEEGSVIVAGDGGAAGAIIAWLLGRFSERKVSIYNVNPMGTLFTRGDGYAERRWFSDPDKWADLSEAHRNHIISHTESGVVSVRNKVVIDQSPQVEYLAGKALEVDWDNDTLKVDVAYENEPPTPVMADYLISAIGYDSWSLLDLIVDPAVDDLRSPGNDQQRARVLSDMPSDMSLPAVSRLPAGIHVPGMAALSQGPGMGNLNCLGLMAAAILDGYLES